MNCLLCGNYQLIFLCIFNFTVSHQIWAINTCVKHFQVLEVMLQNTGYNSAHGFTASSAFLPSKLSCNHVSTEKCITTCCMQCSSFLLSPPYYIATLSCSLSKSIALQIFLTNDLKMSILVVRHTHGYIK